MRKFTEELAHREIIALIASGAESTHTLQGVFEVFVRSNLQTDIPTLKIGSSDIWSDN